jgi:hypothetical protein
MQECGQYEVIFIQESREFITQRTSLKSTEKEVH